MRRYAGPTRRDWLEAFGWIGLYIIAMSVAFFIYWPSGFLVAIVGMIALIAWHRRTVAYRCAQCGEAFEISFLTDLISPHGIGRGEDRAMRGWKYLRCPHCGKRSRATALIVMRGPGDEGREPGDRNV